MSDYNDKYVKCPFYIRQGTRRIRCSGFSDDCCLHIIFSNAESKQAHTEKYCNRIYGYPKCPFYPVIAKRFE